MPQTIAFGSSYVTINGQDHQKGERLEYNQYNDFAEIEIIDRITGNVVMPRTGYANITKNGVAYATANALRDDLRANFFYSAPSGSGGGGSANAVEYDTDSYSSHPAVHHVVTLTEAEYAAIVTPDQNTLYILFA